MLTVDRNILPGMKPTRHSFSCGQPLGSGVPSLTDLTSFDLKLSGGKYKGVAWCSLVFNVLTLSYFSYTFFYFHPFTILYICKYVPTNACAQETSRQYSSFE